MDDPPAEGSIAIVLVVNLENTCCGLCGQTGSLKKTECYGRFLCATTETDPKVKNILDVCSCNHSNYTLCGNHHKLGHDKQCDWRDCSECKANVKFLEQYVGYGTSHDNFPGDWKNSLKFEKTYCHQCGKLLKFNIEGFITKANGTCICDKHQQLNQALARRLITSGLASGNLTVESFGIS